MNACMAHLGAYTYMHGAFEGVWVRGGPEGIHEPRVSIIWYASTHTCMLIHGSTL